MNEDQIEAEGIEQILSLINNEFGGWPILQGSNWDDSTFDFTRLLLKLNQYKYFIIYRANSQIDDRNSSVMGIRVRPIINFSLLCIIDCNILD